MFFPFLYKKLTPEDYSHAIITPFNLDYSKARNDVPEFQYKNPKWLDVRFELFEKYCFPSVKAQTDKNFVWIINFHRETPDIYRERIERYQKECPQIRINPADEFYEFHKNSLDIVKSNTEDKKYLITTRLDSDDGLSVDYVENVHKRALGAKDYIIDFVYGYNYDAKTKEVYYRKHRRNMFPSRIEERKNAKLILSVAHSSMDEYAPIYRVKTSPMWVNVIHGGNIMNTVDGDKIDDLTDFKARFRIAEK